MDCRTCAVTFILVCFCAGHARASIIVSLDPQDGAIAGIPGQTVGWGFTILPDPVDWATIVVTTISFDTNPGLGTYQDYLGPQGGDDDSALAPRTYEWAENFDPLTLQGVGGYTLSANAAAGEINYGTLSIVYELYSQDPKTCPDCYLSTEEVELPFLVTAVPEPDSFTLLLCGLVTLGAGVTIARCRRAIRNE